MYTCTSMYIYKQMDNVSRYILFLFTLYAYISLMLFFFKKYKRETHDKLASARDQYQEVMEYLVQFLDENYPPHYVDVSKALSIFYLSIFMIVIMIIELYIFPVYIIGCRFNR